MGKYKILVLDSDPVTLETMNAMLERSGYEVKTCQSANAGIEIALDFFPQLILIEVLLIGMDGIETCLELRKRQKLDKSIIVFYTSRDEEFFQISAFSAGADDYLIKPLASRVLLQRIKVLLRRYYGDYKMESETNEFGNLVINREKYEIYKNGIKIDLSRKEFELLSLLSSKPGKVYTRQEILAKIWGNQFESNSRTIDVHICKIREKIGEECITTIKGIGYRFNEKF